MSWEQNIRHWICKCTCGNLVEVPYNNLKSGSTKSCGCLLAETAPQNKVMGLKKRRTNAKGFYKRKNKYVAKITVDRKIRYLGSFETELDAREAHQKAVKELLEEKDNGNQ